MSDNIQVFQCGPSSKKCKCRCLEENTCEHKWDGPMVPIDNGETAVCSRCGDWAINHDMWL